MAKNPLFDLSKYGQSVWFDTISRGLVKSGGLQRLVDDYAVVGVTSNPTIFDKAISGSADYDDEIRAMAAEGKSAPEIFWKLATDDIRWACDVLRPIYESSGHVDGRVSIEVAPDLAHNTAETASEARRLWQMVDRPNLMIKIPGTHEGVPAIEEMIYEGLSINVTLLFAVSMHEAVMEAYLKGLERRVAEGKPIDQIFSVASFFVSRVDTMVDKELEAKIKASKDPTEQAHLKGLLGKAANANAKMAYQAFKRVFSGPRWEKLREQGANVQRPLWASTSTKNPAYPDTKYIDTLIGPNTVNTVPPQTLDAIRDRATPARTIDLDVEQAYGFLERLKSAGFDYDALTAELLTDGVKQFADSFEKLMADLDAKRRRFAP